MSKPSQFMVTSDLPVGSSRSARLRPMPMVRTNVLRFFDFFCARRGWVGM